jgi:Spy/CpxP family protein refolding chaperone
MKKTIGIAAAALVVAGGVVALTGFAGGGLGCHRHGHGHDPAEISAFVTNRVDDVLDDLDATPEQRTRINAVKERMLAAGLELRGSRGETHDALFGEWKSGSPDAAKLHALVDTRFEAMKAIAQQAVDAGVEVHGILTPEQREQLTRKAERWHR